MLAFLKRPPVALSIGLAFSGLFLWLAMRNIDLGSLGPTISKANWHWFPASALSLAAFCVVKAWRWAELLKVDDRATTGMLLPPLLIGYMFTSLLPMQLGEIVRAHVAARRLQQPFTLVLSSMIAERVFDVISILFVFAVSILVGATGQPMAYTGAGLLAGIAIFLLILLVLSAKRPESVRRSVRTAFKKAGPKTLSAIMSKCDSFLLGLAALDRAESLLKLFFLSVGQWLFMWGCVAISLLALGIEVSLVASITVLVALILGMMLPAGPGHIGTFQLAFTLTLSVFGVPGTDAFAASVYYQVTLLGPLIVAGMLALKGSDLTLSTASKLQDDREGI